MQCYVCDKLWFSIYFFLFQLNKQKIEKVNILETKQEGQACNLVCIVFKLTGVFRCFKIDLIKVTTFR